MKKTPITDPIAATEMVWIKKDGSEVLVTAKVGRPYRVDEYSWACPSELAGVDRQYVDMNGSCSMQALALALGLIRTRLGHLLEDGEHLYYQNDRKSKLDIKTLNALFGV